MFDTDDPAAVDGWTTRIDQDDPDTHVVDEYRTHPHDGPCRRLRICASTDTTAPRRTIEVCTSWVGGEWEPIFETTDDVDLHAAAAYVARHWDSAGPPSEIPADITGTATEVAHA
ncbi:hypothetical protein RYH80_18765 [Halobaculum sp. MBLA0147]|uniref:hypothetical protein n=1 Tax=Halobaculum sp. MBLA0147 TaxID=3079934 RepID=UPI0035247F52